MPEWRQGRSKGRSGAGESRPSGKLELQAQDRLMEAGHNEGSTRKEPDVVLIGRGSSAEMLFNDRIEGRTRDSEGT